MYLKEVKARLAEISWFCSRIHGILFPKFKGFSDMTAIYLCLLSFSYYNLASNSKLECLSFNHVALFVNGKCILQASVLQ